MTVKGSDLGSYQRGTEGPSNKAQRYWPRTTVVIANEIRAELAEQLDKLLDEQANSTAFHRYVFASEREVFEAGWRDAIGDLGPKLRALVMGEEPTNTPNNP